MSDNDRATFDPNRRDAGIPEDAPAFPIGTLDEIEELGLSPEHYPCCAKRNKATGVLGCVKFAECSLSIKGKTFEEGGGPRRFAWERVFRGKPVRRREGVCWKLVDDQVFVEDNGGAVQIIAEEGESYDKLEGVAVKTFVNSQGNTEKVVAKDGEYHLPNVVREDKVVSKTVRPFLRPSQNTDIATDVITARVVEKAHAQIRSESVGSVLGVSGARAPLDKRNKGGSKRKGEGPESSAV